ncbi:MAG: pyridoxamine 5'-phosphate oxidase family protein [Gammaproteobacteria bacterium]|uniref:pyridoxamine 5'-phosphate oxidase family protein n=1 Tax=Acidovorax sp. JG5 TaxID=2822718 RepID=UPI001B344803|nr:pyridoxamine 5'-phosphate oxidase family protein [Acidovorax sp. JG5]MBP3982350.1 pyridoxamine 5'-phosphate oxidase family protein [Acidovorax sp. JG5]MBU4424887.1 pyridoxamine 5'-phosphate oxidase family protein [Gammaproteobacteria bacterium]
MIETLEQLRTLYAAPGERALRKQQPQLDVHCQRFIALSPFCVVASGGAHGALLDASPRGGAPGFVKSPGPHTLLLPDAGGNNRLDTLTNLLDDPRIGVLFMIPGVDETLRVNGTARLRDEAQYTDFFTAERQRPKIVIEVRVAEAYLHCSKAFMRSRLWSADAQVDRAALPTMGQMIHDQMGLATEPESQVAMLQRYRAQLAQEQQLGDA